MSEYDKADTEFEITDEAIEGFIDNHGGEMPPFNPVLRVWREVLAPAAGEADAKVTPQWANRMVTSFQGLEYGQMNVFRDRYFGKILELAALLNEEIDSDEDCLTYHSPEEDVEHNSGHYRNLLTSWQLAILGWEMAWETTDEYAAVELAAISEVHKMFFGPTGITAYLDNIKFEYTEADQQQLAWALQELKDGQ
jgi:hypothetical protein